MTATRYGKMTFLSLDAAAYIGDMVSPLKQVMPEYKAVEARISAVVAEVFGVHEVPDSSS